MSFGDAEAGELSDGELEPENGEHDVESGEEVDEEDHINHRRFDQRRAHQRLRNEPEASYRARRPTGPSPGRHRQSDRWRHENRNIGSVRRQAGRSTPSGKDRPTNGVRERAHPRRPVSSGEEGSVGGDSASPKPRRSTSKASSSSSDHNDDVSHEADKHTETLVKLKALVTWETIGVEAAKQSLARTCRSLQQAMMLLRSVSSSDSIDGRGCNGMYENRQWEEVRIRIVSGLKAIHLICTAGLAREENAMAFGLETMVQACALTDTLTNPRKPADTADLAAWLTALRVCAQSRRPSSAGSDQPLRSREAYSRSSSGRTDRSPVLQRSNSPRETRMEEKHKHSSGQDNTQVEQPLLLQQRISGVESPVSSNPSSHMGSEAHIAPAVASTPTPRMLPSDCAATTASQRFVPRIKFKLNVEASSTATSSPSKMLEPGHSEHECREEVPGASSPRPLDGPNVQAPPPPPPPPPPPAPPQLPHQSLQVQGDLSVPSRGQPDLMQPDLPNLLAAGRDQLSAQGSLERERQSKAARPQRRSRWDVSDSVQPPPPPASPPKRQHSPGLHVEQPFDRHHDLHGALPAKRARMGGSTEHVASAAACELHPDPPPSNCFDLPSPRSACLPTPRGMLEEEALTPPSSPDSHLPPAMQPHAAPPPGPPPPPPEPIQQLQLHTCHCSVPEEEPVTPPSARGSPPASSNLLVSPTGPLEPVPPAVSLPAPPPMDLQRQHAALPDASHQPVKAADITLPGATHWPSAPLPPVGDDAAAGAVADPPQAIVPQAEEPLTPPESPQGAAPPPPPLRTPSVPLPGPPPIPYAPTLPSPAPVAATADTPESPAQALLSSGRLALVINLEGTLVDFVKPSSVARWPSGLASRLQGYSTEVSRGVATRSLVQLPRCGLWVKLRPACRSFLATCAVYFRLWLVTELSAAQAREVLQLLDPQGVLLEGRVICGSAQAPRPVAPGQPRPRPVRQLAALPALADLLPLTLVLDDRYQMLWQPADAAHLLHCERYPFFPRSAHAKEKLSFLARGRDECASTGMLACSQETLLLLHRQIFARFAAHQAADAAREPKCDAPTVLATTRATVLQGMVLLFAREISSLKDPKAALLYELAHQLGAACLNEPRPEATHVIALSPGAEEAAWAAQAGRWCVSPAWLVCCALTWHHVREQDFAAGAGSRIPGHNFPAV